MQRRRSASAPPVPGAADATRLARLPALVLDLETTGLDVAGDRVVAIGALAMVGPELEDGQCLDRLVEPGVPIPAAARAIHGLGDGDVAGAGALHTAWPALAGLVAGRVIVGHQIGFDLAVLRAEAARHALAWAPPTALDLARLAAVLEPRETDLSLDGIAERWRVPVRARHTALGDALIAARLWASAIARLEARGIATFGEARAFAARARRLIAHQRRLGWD